jgi:type IV secretory pathway TraG/TraD family ATPase VirD4
MVHKCRGWFGLMLSTFLQVLNNSPRGRWPVLVTCDELGILPKQPLVEQSYAESRKKGVQLFCFFQHTGQTVEIYGESGLTNFESGSDVTIYFNSELETAKRVSERAGRGTAVVPQFSFGKGGPRGNRIERNLSFGEQPYDVLTPQQVMALDRYRAVVFVRGAENANALLLGRRPYFDTSRPGWEREEHARLRRIVAPDPYAPDPYHQKKAL